MNCTSSLRRVCRFFGFMLVLSGAVLAASPTRAGQNESTDVKRSAGLNVTVDPRVELMSIVFRLAGSPEYSQGRLPGYLNDIDQYFANVSDHAVIQRARELRRLYGVSYDAVMSMAIHLKDVESLEPRLPLDADWRALDQRWRPDEADDFLALLRDFVKQSKFQAFLDNHRAFYDNAESRMRELLEKEADLDWFGEFFGTQPDAPFTVIIGLVNGPANYGPKFVHQNGSEELYAIIGAWQADRNGDPIFGRGMIPTLVHEFNHSYINHHVYANSEALKSSGEKVFAVVADKMRRQAYGNWETMLHESLVRAATIRYTLKHQGKPEAEQETQQQIARGFIWMPELVDLLGEYEDCREAFPTFGDFMPRVIAYYNDLAPRINDLANALEAKEAKNRPNVISINPPVDSINVDPSLDQIVVNFDRPMVRGNYSVMLSEPDGRAKFPNVSKVEFNEAGTVFTMHVTLEPNHLYEFTLNSESGGAFQSVEGVKLKPVVVRFKTGDGS